MHITIYYFYISISGYILCSAFYNCNDLSIFIPPVAIPRSLDKKRDIHAKVKTMHIKKESEK
jgi:hypothetical protein